MDERLYFVYLASVPVLGVFAQWLAWKLRLPAILTLLAFGILLGQLVNPDDLLFELLEATGEDRETRGSRLLFPIVSLAVAIILFEGGLTLRFRELKSAGRGFLSLVTVGMGVSAVLTTLCARWVLGFNWGIASLIGTILVVTGPTVVAPLLRQIRPVHKVGSIAKWEGIVIDPLGAIAAVLVFELVAHGEHMSMLTLPLEFGKTVVIGLVGGTVTASILIMLVKQYLIPDYLHGVVFLAATLAVFAGSNLLQEESGLVTVTVLGIVLANQRSVRIHHVVEFKEHLGVLLISCLFIVLGSRFDPLSLYELGWRGLSFLLLLICVVRPLSVIAAGVFTRLTIQEKALLAFLAPRGIVAAAVTTVFALKLTSLSGADPVLIEQAEELVPVTFLVIVGTVTVYGLLSTPLAHWLGLSDSNPQGILIAGADPWIRQLAKALQEEDVAVQLVDTNYSHVAAARMDGIQAECASILSDHVRQELDLIGIGRLLALTANDEVNALAVKEFAHEFGRANVYQLHTSEESSSRRSSVSEHLLGRLLFRPELNHEEFLHRIEHGWEIKRTTLTEEFTTDDYATKYGSSAIPLFLLDGRKNVQICVAEDSLNPLPGTTIVALIEPLAEQQSRSNGEN